MLKDGQRIATYTEQANNISGNSIQTALCDKRGNLWFGVFYGGIMFYDTQKKYFNKFFQKNTQIKMSVHFLKTKKVLFGWEPAMVFFK